MKQFDDKLKLATNKGDMVNINLDWRESVPHPDDRVEYELWTNNNDECGAKCDTQLDFGKNFRGAAQILVSSMINALSLALLTYSKCLGTVLVKFNNFGHSFRDGEILSELEISRFLV